MGRVASGYVNRELLRCTKLGDQPFKRLAQVSHGSLGGITLTVSARTGDAAERGRTTHRLRPGPRCRGCARPGSWSSAPCVGLFIVMRLDARPGPYLAACPVCHYLAQVPLLCASSCRAQPQFMMNPANDENPTLRRPGPSHQVTARCHPPAGGRWVVAGAGRSSTGRRRSGHSRRHRASPVSETRGADELPVDLAADRRGARDADRRGRADRDSRSDGCAPTRGRNPAIRGSVRARKKHTGAPARCAQSTRCRRLGGHRWDPGQPAQDGPRICNGSEVCRCGSPLVRDMPRSCLTLARQ
jgi:hypothetical protein